MVEKKFLWAPRLWVGRRGEHILSYISKINGKQNSGSKGLLSFIEKVYEAAAIEHLKRVVDNFIQACTGKLARIWTSWVAIT